MSPATAAEPIVMPERRKPAPPRFQEVVYDAGGIKCAECREYINTSGVCPRCNRPCKWRPSA